MKDKDGKMPQMTLMLRPDQVAALKAYALRPNPQAEADRLAFVDRLMERRNAKVRRAGAMTEADLLGRFGLTAIVRELESAARTLRHCAVRGAWPAGMRAGWPDVVSSAYESYNSERAKLRLGGSEARLTPSGAEISRMDRALHWLHWLEQRERKIVWARASGLGLRKIAAMLGCSKDTIWRDYIAALLVIASHLHNARRQP